MVTIPASGLYRAVSPLLQASFWVMPLLLLSSVASAFEAEPATDEEAAHRSVARLEQASGFDLSSAELERAVTATEASNPPLDTLQSPIEPDWACNNSEDCKGQNGKRLLEEE